MIKIFLSFLFFRKSERREAQEWREAQEFIYKMNELDKGVVKDGKRRF